MGDIGDLNVHRLLTERDFNPKKRDRPKFIVFFKKLATFSAVEKRVIKFLRKRDIGVHSGARNICLKSGTVSPISL